MALIDYLEELVTLLEQQGVPIRAQLLSGLEKEMIDIYLKPLGLDVPPALYELYQWCNGTPVDTSDLFFDEHFFIPIETAVEEYQGFVPIRKQVHPLALLDYAKCFPFAQLEASYYTIYCDVQPFYGHLHPIIHIYQGNYIAFHNLETMLQTLIVWHQQGVLNPRLLDFQVREQIQRAYNPGLDWTPL